MRSPLRWASVGVLLLACLQIHGATVVPPDKSPRDRLVRVNLDAGERATVLRSDFQSVDYTATPYGLAFVGPPDRYAVLVMSDSGLQTLIVQITDDGVVPPKPEPDDPKPDDPKPDDPKPPPADLLNRYGVGLPAYQSAVAIGDRLGAVELGNEAVGLANRMHGGTLLADQARAQFAAACAQRGGPWAALQAEAYRNMESFVAANGTGLQVWRDMFWELGLAMQKASR